MAKDPTQLDAIALSALIKSGKLSCVDVMKATLEKISQENPKLNAIIALADFNSLLQKAREKDDLYHDLLLKSKKADTSTDTGNVTGNDTDSSNIDSLIPWLHGIPLAIKDMSNAKGYPTTKGGAYRDIHMLSQCNDPFVRRLIQNGAIIIGKTNTPEFGLGSHTYNSLWGCTKNVSNPRKSAGGSSGGAAVALSSHMTCLSDGSDMMGSLRNPAGWNGIYSMRPTATLLSEIEDLSEESETVSALGYPISTVGPMARNPHDLIMMLQTMVGDVKKFNGCKKLLSNDLNIVYDEDDDDERGLKQDKDETVKKDEREEEHRKLFNIGWLGDWGGAYPMENGILYTCLKSLQQFAKATCDESHSEIVHVKEIISITDLSHEPLFPAKDLWRSWTAIRSRIISDSILEEFDREKVLGEGSSFKPEVRYEVMRGMEQSPQELQDAIATSKQWAELLENLFQEYDAFALPSAQLFPFPVEWDWPKEIDGRGMDTYHRWMEVVVPVSLAGLPCVTVPAVPVPASDGMEDANSMIGIQIFGAVGDDVKLLELAQMYYNGTKSKS